MFDSPSSHPEEPILDTQVSDTTMSQTLDQLLMNELSPQKTLIDPKSIIVHDGDGEKDSKSVVYYGNKGSLHREQANKRPQTKTDWFEVFVKRFFGGDHEKAKELVAKFHKFDKNKSTTGEASGIIASYIAQGCKEGILRDVFHIGNTRYRRIREMKGEETAATHGGRNNLAYGKQDLQLLSRFIQNGVPVEPGFACQHRRQMVYCTDSNITSLKILYDGCYLNFEPTSRHMAFSTFARYLKAHHPEFNLKMLREDACDVCVELKTQLLSKDLSKEDRVHIEQALEAHGDHARSLRATMGDVIVKWGGALSEDMTLALKRGIKRFVDITIDDDQPTDSWTEDFVRGVVLQCEDFGGNLTLPWFGSVRPGTDYFTSKLAQYIFIVSDLSRNLHHVYVYDERAMGKNADALISLRLVHHLRKMCEYRESNVQRPTALFQIMDNCVGQNKSQAVMMFFALLSMTLYPDGVTLLFLLPGHSHMACDRVVSWLRRSLKSANLFLPQDFVEQFNKIPSVRAEFLDHLDPNRLMFCNFETILKRNMVTIPPIPGGGYTKMYYFQFYQGVLTARKAPDSTVEFKHQYVQGLLGTDDDVPYEDLRSRCVQSIEAHIFLPGKTFDNASVADIMVGGAGGLAW